MNTRQWFGDKVRNIIPERYRCEVVRPQSHCHSIALLVCFFTHILPKAILKLAAHFRGFCTAQKLFS